MARPVGAVLRNTAHPRRCPRSVSDSKYVNPARKSERVAAGADAARVGSSMAPMWTVLAIGYGVVTWKYRVQPLIEAYERSALQGWHWYDVAAFAVGYALIALAALVCGGGAAATALLWRIPHGQTVADRRAAGHAQFSDTDADARRHEATHWHLRHFQLVRFGRECRNHGADVPDRSDLVAVYARGALPQLKRFAAVGAELSPAEQL